MEIGDGWTFDSDRLVDTLEQRYGLQRLPGTETARTEDGDVYLTLTSGGSKPEGERVPAIYSTPFLATVAFERIFGVWADGNRSVRWRVKPEMNDRAVEDDKWYYVYARAFFS